ncbi:conserved hypothetical protein [Ferroglobus placidus DSM 10642]|uniref:Uncharacterized protein n=1 Tax=Ferroglobus placidus (strain DSM 10642 / AEDII12DO) TaxID=589924 RepID=D3RZ21_FERPA|nr:ThaI family type II restriction endonuclease [Ferroglobus placidus]ADC65734.1 conserved hypothetical protein [Ferroglobus placidus DSM 10642]
MGDRENVVNERNVDPLIQLFKNNPTVLELLGKLWEALYVEGSTPDIGKRREHIIRTMLEEEFGLRVIEAPPMEREWDFSVVVGGEERRYSLKTTEKITTVKVAWNGFPSIERARKFVFKYPIMYVTGDRESKKISIYVFEVEDIETLRWEMGDNIWWIPKGGNPRGFGLNTQAIRSLIKKAEEKENFVTVNYKSVDITKIRDKYWKIWYNVLKKLVLEEG